MLVFEIKNRDDSFWSVLFPRGTENVNTVWNSRWLLIVSIFQMQENFTKVCSPFCCTVGTVWKKMPMGGHAEFLARRQEEYQRTLCDLWVMYGRVTKSAEENQLTQDFGTFNAGNGLQITITCKTKQWLSLSRHYRRVKYYAEFTVMYSLKVR